MNDTQEMSAKPRAQALVAAVAAALTGASLLGGCASTGVDDRDTDVGRARALYQKQDYVGAARQLYEPAAKGDPNAQYALGYMYYYGQGVPQDLYRARSWLEHAAKQGHVDAQKSLTLLTTYARLPPPATPAEPRAESSAAPAVAPAASVPGAATAANAPATAPAANAPVENAEAAPAAAVAPVAKSDARADPALAASAPGAATAANVPAPALVANPPVENAEAAPAAAVAPVAKSDAKADPAPAAEAKSPEPAAPPAAVAAEPANRVAPAAPPATASAPAAPVVAPVVAVPAAQPAAAPAPQSPAVPASTPEPLPAPVPVGSERPAPAAAPAAAPALVTANAVTVGAAAPTPVVLHAPAAAARPRYTLHLLSSRSKADLEHLARSHGLGDTVAYYAVQQRDGVHYRLIYGGYASVAEAHAALKALPEALYASKPWVNNFPAQETVLRFAPPATIETKSI